MAKLGGRAPGRPKRWIDLLLISPPGARAHAGSSGPGPVDEVRRRLFCWRRRSSATRSRCGSSALGDSRSSPTRRCVRILRGGGVPARRRSRLVHRAWSSASRVDGRLAGPGARSRSDAPRTVGALNGPTSGRRHRASSRDVAGDRSRSACSTQQYAEARGPAAGGRRSRDFAGTSARRDRSPTISGASPPTPFARIQATDDDEADATVAGLRIANESRQLAEQVAGCSRSRRHRSCMSRRRASRALRSGSSVRSALGGHAGVGDPVR